MQQFQEGQTRTRRSTGEVQEFRNGAWVTVKEGSGPQPMMSVQTRGANPLLPSQVAKAQNDAAASQYAPSTAAAEARIKEADAANARQIADAEARKAEADARAAEAAANNPQTKMTADIRKQAIDGYHTAQFLRGIIDNLNVRYDEGPGATSGLSGIADYLPLTENKRFDDAANAARGTVGNAFAFTGGQLNTKSESALNVGPYLPQSSDRDAEIKDKIGYLNELADNAEKKAIATLGGVPDAQGNIKPVPLNAPRAPDQMTFADGKTKSEVDPILKGVGARVSMMLADPKTPDGSILKFLRENNVDPASTSIMQALQERKKPEVREYMRRNPGQGYPLGPNFYTKEVPLSKPQALLNDAAQSSGGAYLGAAANAIAGNHLKDINPQAEVGLELLRQSHPVASMVGDASGQALIQGAVPMGRLGKYAELGRDTLYGAYSGDGTATGTLGSIAANAGGGVAGRRLGDVARVGFNGIKPSDSLRYLNSAGVPLTIGQIARGTNTATGRFVSGLEDRMAGMPGSDAIINTARQRGMEGFDQAAFKEAGGSGAIGAQGINELGGKVDSAYSFLDNAQVPLDAQYAGTNAGIRASLPNMEFGRNVGQTMDEIDRNSVGGVLSGRDWQDSLRAARDDAGSLKGQPFSRKATATLGDLQDNLAMLAARQGPPNAATDLKGANKLYTNYRTLANALDNSPAVGRGEVFGPGRLDTAARASARKFGSQTASMGGNRPFYDLTKAGMDVLPQQVPDSGTAGRYMAMAMLGGGLGLGAVSGAVGADDDRSDGAVSGGTSGLLTALALAAPYSKTGQKGLQKLLLGERPKALKAAGNYLTNAPTNAIQATLQGLMGKKAQGALGGATLRDILLYPDLPQNY